MTELEKETIAAILDHPHLKQADKEKYVAALLLMTPKKQAEFAELLKNFQDRCEKIEHGDFLVNQEEGNRLAALFDGIKKRLFLKIRNNLA